ncbi:MAG TPA: hypothetical protein PLP29_18245 [Candidatus Ozemobacteraceae bacterium]|nr:hypothetical protein [Candidatus Ozemobacteraceae bacterium]
MRKLLALLLVTALIPFLTGCRVDGLWGYDDDESSASITKYNNIAPVIRVPVANGVLKSLKGTAPSSLRCFVKVTAAKAVSGWLEMAPSVSPEAVLFTLPAGTTLTADELILGNGKMQFRFVNTGIDGNPVVVEVVAVPITQTTTSTTGTIGSYRYAIEIEFIDATTVSVGFTESSTMDYTSGNFPTPTATDSFQLTEGTVDTASYYTIQTLEYSANGGAAYTSLSQNLSAPTDINLMDLQTLKFRVTFSDEITNRTTATFSMTLDNTNTPSTSTTIDALGAYATSEWAVDGKSVVITINQSVPLLANGKYTITLKSFSGSAGLKTLLAKATAYFIP